MSLRQMIPQLPRLATATYPARQWIILNRRSYLCSRPSRQRRIKLHQGVVFGAFNEICECIRVVFAWDLEGVRSSTPSTVFLNRCPAERATARFSVHRCRKPPVTLRETSLLLIPVETGTSAGLDSVGRVSYDLTFSKSIDNPVCEIYWHLHEEKLGSI
jgi:hypothetical protein